MTVHAIQKAPPAWLGEALERFEARFWYPLGEGVHFRISHGREYLPFFQAMGEATVWVAERADEVQGTLSAVVRTLRLPGGAVCRVAYLCDLKVRPDGGGGRVLAKLARAAVESLRARGIHSAYSVVMAGTPHTPEEYTGRLGVPLFSELGRIMVIKVMTDGAGLRGEGSREVMRPEVEAAYLRLGGGWMCAEAWRPEMRCLHDPVPLMAGDGKACGVVEDTRRGKQLWLNDGGELSACHLSRLAYADVASGVALVRDAVAVAAGRGVPAMFFAVGARDAAKFEAALTGLSLHLAPAVVYGCGLPDTAAWSVDTAEI